MNIYELSAKEYGDLVGKDVPVFCRKDFLVLNAYKVEKVHYLVGKDTKNRVVVAIGEINGEWKAPFSAPFSNLIFLRNDISLKCLWDFIQSLNAYAKNNGAKSINLYLPADIYCAQSNSKVTNALLGTGYKIVYQDINYSLDLQSFEVENYVANLRTNARRNLRIALASKLRFIKCETDQEKEEAYDVIALNRSCRGFPLRMTKQQLMDTIKVVEHDIFLVKNDEKSIASAVVYRITNDIAQVVYWGDIADVSNFKPINFISYELVKYYKALNFRGIDIGISTEEGKPNYGLCSFKESIGCIPSVKCRYQIDFKEMDVGSKSIEFHFFDDAFCVSSWKWLNDPEIKEMTDSPAITEENQKEWFESLNSRGDYKIWGVIYNDKRIGVVGIKKIDFERKVGEYFGYIGEKTYWGKGIGKQMIEFSIKEARKLALKKIVLHVIPWNQRAVKLYEKNGFVLNESQSTKDNLLYEYKISNS